MDKLAPAVNGNGALFAVFSHNIFEKPFSNLKLEQVLDFKPALAEQNEIANYINN